MMLRLGFSMWWCMVSFSGSIIWVFPMGILVRLGLRYRLLWVLGLRVGLFLGFYLWVLGELKVEV